MLTKLILILKNNFNLTKKTLFITFIFEHIFNLTIIEFL